MWLKIKSKFWFIWHNVVCHNYSRPEVRPLAGEPLQDIWRAVDAMSRRAVGSAL